MIKDQHRFSEQGNTEAAASMADFDADDYRLYLDGLDLDQGQEDALMSILWDIVRMSVELNIPPESWGQFVDVIIDASADESADVD